MSEGSTTPGAPVAAVPWEDSFALFITNPQGSVYTIKAAPGYGWQLVPGLTSKPGAPITALASGGRFVLFSTDASGEVFTTSGIPYQEWPPSWTSVSEGSTTPGAPIAAVPWEDGFALFLSNPQGGIYGIKATPGYGWEPVLGCSAKPGAQVTAINEPRTPEVILLFVTDVRGEILMTLGTPYNGWITWSNVSNGVSVPGAPVTALAFGTVPPNSGFVLFSANPGGEVQTSQEDFLRTTHYDNQATWSGTLNCIGKNSFMGPSGS